MSATKLVRGRIGEIVERHDGTLSASSDGKNGARFHFVLPVGLTDTD